MNRYDWRQKDEMWQKRSFLLSAFVRMKAEITPHVYEFIDYLISQGYQAPLGDLNEVDYDVKRLYTEYAEHTNWDDRI